MTSDDQVAALVIEKKAADKDEVVRTVNIKVKATFKRTRSPELTIPITVYKNVYEAFDKEGDKPKYLSDAEKLEAKTAAKDNGNYVSHRQTQSRHGYEGRQSLLREPQCLGRNPRSRQHGRLRLPTDSGCACKK
ncbi:MAG: hypothetical protein ACLVLI_00345 [Aedoeadaptatus pacaensis]